MSCNLLLLQPEPTLPILYHETVRLLDLSLVFGKESRAVVPRHPSGPFPPQNDGGWTKYHRGVNVCTGFKYRRVQRTSST